MRRFAMGVLGWNLAVIAWGAFVRATGSGAGCGSHWPTCDGAVLPRPRSMEMAIELTHRITSGLALVLVIALVIAAFIRRGKGHPLRRASLASLFFVLTEAAVGAGIVLLEHVAHDASVARVWWMGMHLVNTFLLLAALALCVRYAALDARAEWQGSGMAALVGAMMIATLGVAVTGAVTALGDTLFPAASLHAGLVQDASPTAHLLVRLRVWHPIAAIVCGLFVAGSGGLVAMARPTPAIRKIAITLGGLFLGQIAAGLLNVLLLAPTWLQLAHLLMADAVWIALVLLGAEALATTAPVAREAIPATP